MCCGSGEQTTGTSTTSNEPGPLTKAVGTAAADKALQISNQTYPGFDWTKRVAPINAQQQNAFGSINTLSGSKLLDESGPLGPMSGYMDPYITGVLDPTIRRIAESGQQARKQIGDQAQFSHAFGDARHGVEEGIQRSEEQRNIGDATGAAYSSAWNSGVNLRQQDLTNLLNGALARLGIGDRLQAQDQSSRDAEYGEFKTASEWPQRQLDALLSFITGNPTAQTVTTTNKQPTNILSQLLGAGGAVAGSLL